MTTSAREAQGALEAAFGEASPEHFAWQTRASFVGDRERELTVRAFTPLGARVLDVGCGEGATLAHLGAPPGAVGVDLFEPKVAFARRALPGCTFVRASATNLPFDDGAFDHVLVRDVVHHVERKDLLAFELCRVLAPGGRLDVLEPCRNNPLVLAHALAIRAERGELRSTEKHLRRVFAPRFDVELVQRMQALPLHRVIFNPRFGAPGLADVRVVAGAVGLLEKLADRVLPEAARAYLHLRFRPRGAS